MGRAIPLDLRERAMARRDRGETVRQVAGLWICFSMKSSGFRPESTSRPTADRAGKAEFSAQIIGSSDFPFEINAKMPVPTWNARRGAAPEGGACRDQR